MLLGQRNLAPAQGVEAARRHIEGRASQRALRQTQRWQIGVVALDKGTTHRRRCRRTVRTMDGTRGTTNTTATTRPQMISD